VNINLNFKKPLILKDDQNSKKSPLKLTDHTLKPTTSTTYNKKEHEKS
jgi:hypothetical protein